MRRALVALVTIAAVLALTATTATAKGPVIRGHLDTTATVASGTVTFQGHGVLTSLGRSHMTATQTVGPTGLITGSGQLTAANGDRLQLTWTNIPVAPAGPAQITFAGTMKIMNGSGRLAGRTGDIPFSGGFSFVTSRGWMDLSPRS